MTNPNFSPTFSTNELYRDLDTDVCLTDLLDGYESAFDSLSSTYAAKNHTHSGYADNDDIAAIQDALSNKSDVSHTHSQYDYGDEITALQSALSSKANANHSHSNYATVSHTHTGYATTSDVDALETVVASKAASDHTHSNYALVSHNHNGSYAALNHSHSDYATDEDITALQSAVNSKADASHAHSNYASSSHNHDSSYYTKSSIDSKLSAKAEASVLTTHTGNSDIHITSAEKANLVTASAQAQIVTTTGTGAAYVATVEGITALTAGIGFIMIPHVTPTQVNPTLNVNGLGAKNLRMRVSNSTTTTTPLSTTNLVMANKPTRVMYDGTQWVIDIVRPNVSNLYGVVGIDKGGTGATTAAAARTNLDVYSKAEVEALIAQAIANL